jgi:hypothetical protein
MVNQLPDKPSELLRTALSDLRACEGDPKYKINMHWWHRARLDGCYVCLAGAVMAKTLEFSFEENVAVYNFDNFFDRKGELNSKLSALDWFRRGEIFDAFVDLGVKKPETLPDEITITPYEEGPEEFHRDMEGLITMLEQEGL